MALSVDTEHMSVPVNGAYVTVITPSVDKTSMLIGVYFRANPNDAPFKALSYTVPYSLEGENPFKQAYEHLKTLPEFEGSMDC